MNVILKTIRFVIKYFSGCKTHHGSLHKVYTRLLQNNHKKLCYVLADLKPEANEPKQR